MLIVRRSLQRFSDGVDPTRNHRPSGTYAFGIEYNLRRYVQLVGSAPDIEHPTSFSEKVWARMVFDRRPWLTRFADKLSMKDRLTAMGKRRYVIPDIARGASFQKLPPSCFSRPSILKAAHSSGRNFVVLSNHSEIRKKAEMHSRRVLRESYDRRKGEWAYKHVKRRLYVEPLISLAGIIPTDVQVYCFSGEPIAVHVVDGRSKSHSRIWVLRNDFHNLRLLNYANTQSILRTASEIACEIDFIRVDFIAFGGCVKFAECTVYPFAGIPRFISPEIDNLLGQAWSTTILEGLVNELALERYQKLASGL